MRYFILLLPLSLWTGVRLPAQTVNITPISADFVNQTVTFGVSWTGTTTPANSVWVWIDYCPISGVTPAGTYGA
ncbi:MAG: hypothetical protein LBB31_00255, partial [Prevotellaceae bacterium]|nr:hypothetical protein [Prevotellaceae bacterium]